MMMDDPSEMEFSREDEREESNESGSAQKESENVQIRESLGISERQAVASDHRSLNHLWLVSYSDFMTIMMIFFLGLYGYTVLAKAALIKEQQKRRVTYTEFSRMVSELKNPLGDQMQIQEDVGKIVIQLPEDILFASSQATLNQNAIRTLGQIAESLKRVEGDIIVEGHTDNVPIRGGRYRSNMELSTTRAFSVIEALTQSGVPNKRLAAWGFGEFRPVASNQEAKGRAKNRRIDLVLLKKMDNAQ